jgi:hypothetical protein
METEASNNDRLFLSQSSVILDEDISPEKLRTLISLNREQNTLDYKQEYDLSSTHHKVELACDVVAMANSEGGYIVIGVAEPSDSCHSFSPCGLNQDQLHHLDQTEIYQQVSRYISAPVEIQLQIHSLPEYDGKVFALLHVKQSRELPIVFSKDGQYERGGRTKSRFSAGEIFVRRGAASVRADQNDMRRIISHIRRREKNIWTEEILGIKALTRKVELLLGEISESTDRVEVTSQRRTYDDAMFYVSNEAFEHHIMDLIEDGNELGIRRYLQQAAPIFIRHLVALSASQVDEIQRTKDNLLIPILDNLLVIGNIAVEYNQYKYFQPVVSLFKELYISASDIDFPETMDEEAFFSPSWLWQELIIRVYALGAVLIKNEAFDWVSHLALVNVPDYSGREMIWTRHALMVLSREKRTGHPSLCPITISYIRESDYLSLRFLDNEDRIIGSVCQFDFFQSLILLNIGKMPFPSFGVYYNYRTEPIISKLVRKTSARDAISAISDKQLANLIRELDEMAHREFLTHAAWDRNEWTDPEIRTFLNKNLPDNDVRTT